MKTEGLLRKQLTNRLRRLRDRATAIFAEIQLVERLLAEAERGTLQSSLKLRKNGVVKLSVQAQVKKHLGEAAAPVKAQRLYNLLRAADPGLKSSTFRSHVKRMAEAGIIKQEGPRGHYRLAEKPDEMGTTDYREPVYRSRWVRHSIYER